MNPFRNGLTKTTSLFNSAVCAIALSGCVSITQVEPKIPEMPAFPDDHVTSERLQFNVLAHMVSKIDDCGANSINFIRCASILKLLADKNPNISNTIQEAMTENNIDGKKLENIKKTTLGQTIKNTLAAFSENGQANRAAQANLLALYDGRREEFAGLEDLARETIDEALEKRGLDIENIRAAHELESRKVGHTPYHCGKSENGKGVVICAPLFTPQTIEY